MSKQTIVEEPEVIPSNKVKCLISGKLRINNAEERVRQDVARSLVEEYGYGKSDMDIEFQIRMGKARKRLDIVVFPDGKAHTQENVYLIIETKQEGVKPSSKSSGVDQLASYVAACPNGKFALWVGSERLAFEVVEMKGQRRLAEIPDIPKKGEATIARPTRGSLVPAVKLKNVFRRIHNYIYANQGLQKDKAFEELQKLIFIKVFDEQYAPSLQFYVLPGEEITHVRKRLMSVFTKVQKMYKYIFKGNETIELDDMILHYVVSELQRFTLVDTETDIKGEAYEEIVGPNLRGDRGEFFTPRNVCKMTIDMLFSLVPEEDLSSPGALKILDPAVGTGGFLIAGVQRIRELIRRRGHKYDKLRDLVRDVVDVNFYGIDFNPFLVKVAQMNMVMHGDGSSKIVHANSLDNPRQWNSDAAKKVKMGEFDLVVTNPPFGTKAVIDNPAILEQYELTTYDASSPRASLPPEQLFIERCLEFLKPEGFLGIVLPDSILTNPGLSWIRKWIMSRTYAIASIDLPTVTFEPSTGTQTSILILRKKKDPQLKLEEDYEIFMAIPEKVGHDRRGNPVVRRTPAGEIEIAENGQPVIDDHLPIVAKLFREWVKERGLGV